MDAFPENAKKILIFKLGGLGDYTLILPFIEDLRTLYPDSEISAITAPSGKELLEHQGIVNHLILAPSISISGRGSLSSLASLMEILQIRKQLQPPYDIFIDLIHKFSLTGDLKPRLFCALARPKLSIGLSCGHRGKYLNIAIPEERYEVKHNIERYAEIIRRLGGRAEIRTAQIQLPKQLIESADQFYSRYRSSKLKIGLHPGANLKQYSSRAWPLERFAELVNRISGEFSAYFFMTGSKEEEPLYNGISKRVKVPIVRIPITESVVELCAYLKGLNFYIANDTGPMHLAVTMRTPTIGIFGAGDFESYGSYPGSPPFRAVTLDKKKSPPFSKNDPRGLQRVSVDQVFAEFMQLKKAVS